MPISLQHPSHFHAYLTYEKISTAVLHSHNPTGQIAIACQSAEVAPVSQVEAECHSP